MKKFKDNFKKLVIDSGLSQIQIGEKVGISSVSVSHYITGRAAPKLKYFYKICNAFNISPNEMLGWSDACQGCGCTEMLCGHNKRD